jgi:hypothetical protein
MFVVLRRPGRPVNEDEGPAREDTVGRMLEGAWTVRFDQREVTFDKLVDWSKSEDTTIRYYSGTAVYSQSFDWSSEKGGRVWLDLGRVADIAEVWVNGVNCGVAWTKPYRVEITKALRKGRNELRIGVTNTWANRLIGDHRRPEEKRVTWTNAPYRLDGKLVEAGLMGKVRIIY